MKLGEYLKDNDIGADAFAGLVGASARAVIKWQRGERIPRPDYMARIAQATNGAVQASDFYPASNEAA